MFACAFCVVPGAYRAFQLIGNKICDTIVVTLDDNWLRYLMQLFRRHSKRTMTIKDMVNERQWK